MLSIAVSFVVVALLLSPTGFFLTNGCLMKKTLSRAAKSRPQHLDFTLQDWGNREETNLDLVQGGSEVQWEDPGVHPLTWPP